MEQAKQGGNETAPEMAGYYRGAGCFSLKAAELNELLGVGRCFDMTGRDLSIGGRQARLWVVNGYAQEDLLERVIAGWQALPDLNSVTDAADFCRRYVSACDAAAEPDRDTAVMGVFAGKTLAIIDGFGGGVVLDAKQFPTRSVEEPDTSRVLRGSHDGFVENLMQNAALLRRRVRDTHLRLERLQLPERSGTDVALCYMEGEADEGLLRALREKLMHIQLRSVAMSQETIAEAIAPRQFWNPFPKVRYTERPDVATACIMEGDVVVLVDNSASALLLPTTILRFNEEINDYYFPPLIGTYLRIVRLVVLFLTVFITPLWYLLVKNGEADLSACDSLDNGVITLYNGIKSKVNADFDILLDESDIDAILKDTPTDFDESVIRIVQEQAQQFINDLFGKLRERMIDLRSGKAVFVGGGSILLKKQIEASGKVGAPIFVDEISANTKGYELLFKAACMG